MFRTILVPLDGSRLAEFALPWAARLARRSHCRMVLTMVHEPAAALVSAGGDRLGAGSSQERDEVAGYLARTASHWQACRAIPVGSELAEGVAGPGLVELIGRIKPDLVVMASHGQGAMTRLWIGSVADYLLRRSEAPILLVRPPLGAEIPVPEAEVRRILAVVDGGIAPDRLLEPVGALANVTQAHVTLFQAVDPTAGPAELTDAQRGLDRLADRMRLLGHRVAARAVRQDEGEGVLQALKAGGFDVVAVRTRSGPAGSEIAPVTDRLIRAASQPILLAV